MVPRYPCAIVFRQPLVAVPDVILIVRPSGIPEASRRKPAVVQPHSDDDRGADVVAV